MQPDTAALTSIRRVASFMTDRYPSLRDAFFDECDALLGSALSLRAKLATAGDPAAFKELHRCVHGVAGAASSMDMPQLASLARALETVLDPLRATGAWPDARCSELCGDALEELVTVVRQLRAGLVPDWRHAAALEGDLQAGGSMGGATQTRGVRRIAFRVSRSLVGAEIVVEHVLEELQRTGRVEREREGIGEGSGGEWCLRFVGAVSDDWIRELLGGVAEPGSVRVEQEGDDRPGAWANRPTTGVIADGLGRRGEDPGCDEGEWFVAFRLAAQRYVFAAERVLDVRPYRGEFVLPGMPAGVRGLIGVGEEAVPLIDGYAALLGQAAQVPPESAAMLVLQAPGGMIALLADEAGQDVRVKRGQLRTPAALAGVFAACPVSGLCFGADYVSLVVDVERLCAFLDPTLRRNVRVEQSADEGRVQDGADRRGFKDASRSSRSTTIAPAGPPVPPAPRRGRVMSAGRRTLEEEWGLSSP